MDYANLMILFASLDGFIWFVILLLLLIFLQRALHREIQAVFLITTRRPGLTQALFAMIFFPGVFLHETSHYVAAKLLGVATGKYSLIPQSQPDGKLRLGFVETASGGIIKDAIIGVAPLVSGCLFVAFSAIYKMHLVPLWDMLHAGQFSLFWLGISLLPKTSGDFWLWFYLTIAVSSTMTPSSSDRHAWLPVGLISGSILTCVLFAGAGPWMLEHIAPVVNDILRALASIIGLSSVVHVILVFPFFLFHKSLVKMTGIDIRT